MNERYAYLNSKEKSARCSTVEAGHILGFEPYAIPILCKKKLLIPLGFPAKNAPKFFCYAKLAELATDEKWLSRATLAVSEAIRTKRGKRSTESQTEAVL